MRERSASRIVFASDDTSGDTAPVSTDSATVTGSVRSSQIVAPAMTAASTPTIPTRLKLRLPNRTGARFGDVHRARSCGSYTRK